MTLIFLDHVCVNLIFTNQAQTSLKEVASCFVVLYFLEVKGDLNLNLISVARDFLEVFPKEIPSLPPR